MFSVQTNLPLGSGQPSKEDNQKSLIFLLTPLSGGQLRGHMVLYLDARKMKNTNATKKRFKVLKYFFFFTTE